MGTYQNASIATYSCIKDKYSNVFIRNNRLNLYSAEKNTVFYVYNAYYQPDDSPYSREISYWLTDKGQVVSFPDKEGSRFLNLNGVQIYNGFNQSRPIEKGDDYLIYQNFQNNELDRTFKIRDGYSYSYQTGWVKEWINSPGNGFRHSFWSGIFSLDSNQETGFRNDTNIYNTRYLEKDDLLIGYTEQNKVVAYPNFFNNLKKYFFPDEETANYLESYIVIEDVIYEKDREWWDGSFVRYDLNGKQTYEIIAERNANNELIINAYLAGTYVAPETTTVTLQPINR